MTGAQHTPRERAENALGDSVVFCNLLAQARQYKAPGWWEGSAFRRHPCGLVADTIKLTNHWHVDDLCDICITDGAGWDVRNVCRDSFSHSDPHPQPIEGGSLQVWRCGRWADAQYEQALRPKLLEILTAAATHVEAAEGRERQREEAERLQAAERHAALTANAIAKATGSTS